MVSGSESPMPGLVEFLASLLSFFSAMVFGFSLPRRDQNSGTAGRKREAHFKKY